MNPFFRICIVAGLCFACMPLLSYAERTTRELPGANGKKLTVVMLEPTDKDKIVGTVILLPPGPGTKQMVKQAEQSLGKDFAKRNWRVVIPQAPNGRSFIGSENKHVTSLLSQIQGQRVVLEGISNGGISAMEAAASSPQKVKGLVLVPGLVANSRMNTAGLRNMPVFLRVGAKDELGWTKVYEPTVKKLKTSGAILDAKLVPKTGHVFRVNWKELDP